MCPGGSWSQTTASLLGRPDRSSESRHSSNSGRAPGMRRCQTLGAALVLPPGISEFGEGHPQLAQSLISQGHVALRAGATTSSSRVPLLRRPSGFLQADTTQQIPRSAGLLRRVDLGAGRRLADGSPDPKPDRSVRSRANELHGQGKRVRSRLRHHPREPRRSTATPRESIDGASEAGAERDSNTRGLGETDAPGSRGCVQHASDHRVQPRALLRKRPSTTNRPSQSGAMRLRRRPRSSRAGPQQSRLRRADGRGDYALARQLYRGRPRRAAGGVRRQRTCASPRTTTLLRWCCGRWDETSRGAPTVRKGARHQTARSSPLATQTSPRA